MKYFWSCPICHAHSLKPLLRYRACRNGRRHIINFHGISQDPILVKADFKMELEVDNSSGAKQKKSSLGILKYLSFLFPSGAERVLLPIFGSERTNIIILGGVVIIILKLIEEIFFPEKPSR